MSTLRLVSFTLMVLGALIYLSAPTFTDSPWLDILGWLIAAVGVILYFFDFYKRLKRRDAS